jgi:hypothetical protein
MKKNSKLPEFVENLSNPNQTIARFHLGPMGRLIAGSKTVYNYDNPENAVVYNANLFTSKEKIWYGDLDLTLDLEALMDAAEDLKEPIFVFYEPEGRWVAPDFNNYVIKVNTDRTVDFDSKYMKMVEGKLKVVPISLPPALKLDPKDYPESHFEKVVAAPNVNKLSGDPVDTLHSYLIKTLGKKEAQDVYLDLFATESWLEEFRIAVKDHLVKEYPETHPAKLEVEVDVIMFNYAPSKLPDTHWTERFFYRRKK